MIVKGIDGVSYTLRDWMNNKEFSLMAESQMIILELVGKICNWNQERMAAIDEEGNKDKIELTKQMMEQGLVAKCNKLKQEAAMSIILSPSDLVYDELPRDVTEAAEKQVNDLYIALQPQPEENKPSKK